MLGTGNLIRLNILVNRILAVYLGRELGIRTLNTPY